LGTKFEEQLKTIAGSEIPQGGKSEERFILERKSGEKLKKTLFKRKIREIKQIN